MPNFPTPLRSDIRKTPGRLAWTGAGTAVSIFSKLGTSIERTITHELFEVGTDAMGILDQRDRDYYARVRLTPDGRFTDQSSGDIRTALWPYSNYTPGQSIFPLASDYPLTIYALDDALATASNVSTEVFTSAALDSMPPLKFTATETAIGQAEWLCLRGYNKNWSDANSLVTQTTTNNVNGLVDSNFTVANIETGPYSGTWIPSGTNAKGLTISTFDTLDGINVEFTIQFDDDTRQSVGLINRRIRSVGARVRCSPVGSVRQDILAAQVAQGAGATRGRSVQASNSGLFQISNQAGSVVFTLNGAALTEDKQMWGSAAVRETDLVWVATRTLTAGVPQPLFVCAMT